MDKKESVKFIEKAGASIISKNIINKTWKG